jgi:hypothetical protein
MYWDPSYPRLVTIEQAREMAAAGRLPLRGVCDITCDLRGSVEFLTVSRSHVLNRLSPIHPLHTWFMCWQEYTSIEEPFFIYDPLTGNSAKPMDAPGILYHAVDHLPSECAKYARKQC